MGDVYKIGLNQKENTFFSDRTEAGKTDFSEAFASDVHIAPRLSSSNQVSMRLFLDVSSAELFADGGGTVLTDLFFPNSDFQEIRLYCKGGEVKNVTATTISLNSIWQ
ncbi:MAG: GH32 C-terminal domain-containing protein, partial [Bacteroidota bacterium]